MSSVPRTPPLAGDKPQPYIFLAGSGTPGYENWVHWLMGGSVSSVPRTPPLAGDKPQPYIFLSTPGVAGRLETRYSPCSYQSLMPAGAGTPRYENWVHWLMGGSGVVRATHPAPGGGEAPALHFSGWCRHTKV